MAYTLWLRSCFRKWRDFTAAFIYPIRLSSREFMKTFRSLAHLIASGFLFASLSMTAEASLIVNGDFEAAGFAGWTQYTSNSISLLEGPSGPQILSFDTDNDGISSNAARFRVGQKTVQTGVLAGGGIYQDFTSGAGTLQITMDIAVQHSAQNSKAGLFNLYLDGVLVDSYDFGSIAANTAEYSTLDYTGIVAAGVHQLKIEMLRPFLTGWSSNLTPVQYIDDVIVNGPAAVPEPGSLALLGLGMLGLFASRRRTQR